MTSASACRYQDQQRYATEKPPNFQATGSADEWLKVEVKVYTLKKLNSGGQWDPITGEYFKGSTCWWQIAKVGTDYTVTQKLDYTDANCQINQYRYTVYGIVCVDQYGTVKKLVVENTDSAYGPITGSCWTSLKPV